MESKWQWWNFRTIMGTSNRVGIGLSHRPARQHGQAGEESIPGPLKSLKIPARNYFFIPLGGGGGGGSDILTTAKTLSSLLISVPYLNMFLRISEK